MSVEQPTFTSEELQTEQWRDVVDYEGHYRVSSLGRVKSLKNYHGFKPGRILRVSPAAGGYLKVTLSLNSKLKTFAVAKLVSRAFLGPCPPLHEINHIDTTKTNNRATNLEYVTKRGQMDHAKRMGLLPSKTQRSKTMKRCAARGDANGSRTHPERLRRGDDHWMRRVKGAQRGEKNHRAKLSNAERRAMRRRYRRGGISYKQLGLQFGVCAQAAWNAVNKVWP